MTDHFQVESVTVGSGGGRTLVADLYRPTSPNGVGVLLIHGGVLAQGDRRQLRGYGIALGRVGYTCLACEYRLAGEAKWPARLTTFKWRSSICTALQGRSASTPARSWCPATPPGDALHC
jgi:acetyl esterase/lipase